MIFRFLTRAVCCSLLLSLAARGALAHPAGGNHDTFIYVMWFEVKNSDPPPTVCDPGDILVEKYGENFNCSTLSSPYYGHSPGTDELTAVSGLPFPLTDLYPDYPCVPAHPGGPWIINACDEEPEPGDQCSNDAKDDPASCVGDPIDITTGQMAQRAMDVDLGHGLRFERHYSKSLPDVSTGPIGRRWQHSLEWNLERRTVAAQGSQSYSALFVDRPFQARSAFVLSSLTGTAYAGSQRNDGSVSVETGGTVHYTAPNGTVATFNSSDELVSLAPPGEPMIVVTSGSPDANSTTYSNGQQTLVITKHGSGTDAGRVSTVTGGGKTWSYTYDVSHNLATVTGPNLSTVDGSGTITWTYGYGAGLTSVSRSDLSAPLASWTYNAGSRVSAADEPALDTPLTFTYDVSQSPDVETTISNSVGTLAVVASTDRVITSVVNPSGPENPDPDPNPNAADPIPGGPGVPVPFTSATTDDMNRWRMKTDKNGNVTLFESYGSSILPSTLPGHIVEGWVPQVSSATSFTTGDDFARRRTFVYHPTLGSPLQVTEVSTLTGVFGDRVTTFDYDDPADDPNSSSPNTKPTTRVYKETLVGKTLNDVGSTVALIAARSFTYDSAGRLESITGPTSSNYTKFTYDSSGYRTAIKRYVNGSSSSHLDTTFSNFDPRGNPQTVTDPNGRTTTFTYDLLSRVRTATPPYPTSEVSGPTTDPKITFTYDVDGNLTRIDFPDDSGSQDVFLKMGYDAKNRITFIADSQQNAIVYEYTNGRATRQALYTGFVNLTTRGDLAGDAEFAYDTAGRLVKAFNPLFTDDSVFSEFAPDGNGNPISVEDENGRTDLLVYDALDRLTEIQRVRAATYETQFVHDALSNVTQVTDAALHSTDLLHNDLGNLVQVVSPDTGRTRFVYDAAGNVVTKIENAPSSGSGGRTTTYEYDGLNRLTKIDLPTDDDWIFAYDTSDTTNQKGRLAQVTNGDPGDPGVVTTQFGYTERGDINLERTIIDGYIYYVAYAYDASGNRRYIEAPSATNATTSYGGLRPSSLAITGGSRTEVITNLAWYPFGPRTQAKFPPDDINGNTVTSSRTVNMRGQITEIDVTRPSLTLVDRNYKYDYTAGTPGPNDPGPNLDRVVDALDATESRFFFYDELDRLWKATELDGDVLHEYAYDAVGNRTSKTDGTAETEYAYESLESNPINNRLAAATGEEERDYAHDAYGNRIYDGADEYDATPSLIYDEVNRLVEVRDPEDSFATIATYTYDAFGRRVKKEVGSTVVLFFYDTEGHLVEEIQKVPSSTDIVRTYIYLEDELVQLIDKTKEVGTAAWVAPGGSTWEIDPPLLLLALAVLAGIGVGLASRRWPVGVATTASGGALFLLCATTAQQPRFAAVHVDPLGTPLAVTNVPATWTTTNQAKVVWRAKYEPFGKADEIEDPDGDTATFSLSVRFPGQYEDAETGWHYNYLRHYDPATGRYLEPDLLGVTGSAHLYSYVRSNPINLKDPFGLVEYADDFTGPLPPNGYRTSEMTQTLCGRIPPGPDWEFLLLLQNMQTAQSHWDPRWFYDQVENGAPWDFKQQDPKFEDFGNFNFGSSGKAFGLPASALFRGAGWANQQADPSRDGLGSPLGGPPYGDYPEDQEQIGRGISFCECMGY